MSYVVFSTSDIIFGVFGIYYHFSFCVIRRCAPPLIALCNNECIDAYSATMNLVCKLHYSALIFVEAYPELTL